MITVSHSLPVGFIDHPDHLALAGDDPHRVLEMAPVSLLVPKTIPQPIDRLDSSTRRSRLYLFASLAVVLYTAYRAFRDPTSSTQSAGMGLSTGYLPRFYLPIIGDLAERWVGEE